MNDYPYRPDEPIEPESEFTPDETEARLEAGIDTEETDPNRPKSSSARPIKDALKQVEQAVGAALQGRGNVVMVRVNDEALRHLDMLVEAEITKSRSEAAALLINEGIKANQALFDRIGEITEQIDALRAELRASIRRPQPSEE